MRKYFVLVDEFILYVVGWNLFQRLYQQRPYLILETAHNIVGSWIDGRGEAERWRSSFWFFSIMKGKLIGWRTRWKSVAL